MSETLDSATLPLPRIPISRFSPPFEHTSNVISTVFKSLRSEFEFLWASERRSVFGSTGSRRDYRVSYRIRGGGHTVHPL